VPFSDAGCCVVFLHECNSLTPLSTVVMETLTAILNKMKWGRHGFDPSGEYDNKCGEGWELMTGAGSTGHGHCCPKINAGDLKSAIEYVGTLCLRNALLLAPPDTRWDGVTGDTGGAKRTLRKAIE
jgi:hypothetical protein